MALDAEAIMSLLDTRGRFHRGVRPFWIHEDASQIRQAVVAREQPTEVRG